MSVRRLLVPRGSLLALVAGFALVPASQAQAPSAPAPPANDNRASAQVLSPLPVSLDGTTAGATAEDAEPGSSCANTTGSVWYRLDSGASRRVAVRLHAAGDLDATVDVYLRRRSQLSPITCDATGARGNASTSFRAGKGQSYLIRVAQLANSVAGTFTLDVFAPQPAPRPPGLPLPADGVHRTLDRVQNTADAWSVRLLAGRTYRINESDRVRGCLHVRLFGPGTASFGGASPVRRLPCGGYRLFTPGAGQGGRYSVLVLASSTVRRAQPYRLQVAPAGPDDTAPGVFIRNFARVHGRLSGFGIDVVDLYRFDVVSRSTLFLRLATGDSHAFNVILLSDGGRRLACGCGDVGTVELHRGLHPGHYFVAVRARAGTGGSYTLTRASRTITNTRIRINGARHAETGPGATARIGVQTVPAVSGPVTITIQRFDPLAGWQFSRRIHIRMAAGNASVSFTPPTVGRWRATASYDGTRESAPSNAGFATLRVAGALQD